MSELKKFTDMTQEEIVLWHIKTYGSITSMVAFSEYGMTRLSATIFRLRRKGYAIKSEFENGINRFSHPTQYVRYYLVEESEK